ncbi:putative reverse transcriptase domain-containing protein [Tanacetum coccineum]|uniref:Reverse transcriptase domain-containing protein n=1 Tax=Tanacetum coccineum TaxID=301880 RepID=A0ABQ5ASV7_9ASTR
MVNVIPPDHVDDVPVVEPNQHDDVPVVPELVLVDEDEDPEEEEFEEEEEPQEEDDDDMEVDIEEDENEPELTYPYEEVDPLNPPPPASDLELEDVIEVEDTIESEDETVPASVHKTAHALVEKKGKAKDEYYGKLILDLGNEVRSSVEQGTAAMEKLVENLGNAEEKAECKKLKKALEEARIMSPKSAPLTQAAIRRMIKESVDAAIAVERARHANVRNNVRGSGPVRGQDAAPVVRECTFAGFMNECAEGKKVKFAAATLQGPALTWWNAKVKEYNIVTYTQRFNELALMCPRMVEPESVKQGNARAMTTATIEKKVSFGSLPVCEHYFTHHDGPCMIECHKCGKVGHKARYCKEKNVAAGANAQPILTCYDCGEQGHTRNQCPRKVKQEETGEVRV